MRWMMVLAAALLGACGGGDTVLQADNAWVRLPAVQGRPGAAYFAIRAGADDAVLVKVDTPAALRAELHESMADDHGAMTMQPMQQVAIPAGTAVNFAPGGKHVMLFEVNPAVKPGDTVKLRLHFASGGAAMEIDARVLAAGEAAPK